LVNLGAGGGKRPRGKSTNMKEGQREDAYSWESLRTRRVLMVWIGKIIKCP